MTHRHGCDLPPPDARVTRLPLTGIWVAIHRCPTCGATALHREDHP